ncbi:glutathione S-transferase family protein [Altererythrobacter sp. MF3-039]|uniref:glutathione S-transferase family protein n=1 Tax=Altererythrobacter sp. MF3-039 TaxID=3252901 RepID=UPI00390C79AB
MLRYIVAAGLLSLSACATQDVEQPRSVSTTAMPQVTIYHLEGRRSERIVWLMEELGQPYKLEYVRGDLRASMAKVHALGHEMPQVPTVVIEDEILVESGAIIDTILNRYAPGQLAPAVDDPFYPKHQMWMHYAEGSLAARLFSDYRAWRTNPPTQRSPLVDSEAVVQFAENHLEKHPYFGGDVFSAADIMMHFPLRVALGLNLVDREQFPNIVAWNEKVEARPAYRRMLAAARPDGMIGNLPPVEQRPPSDR